MPIILGTDHIEQLRKAKYKKLTVTIFLDDGGHFSCGFNCGGEADLSLSYRDWLKVSGAIKHLGVLEYLEERSNIGKHRRRNLKMEF